ncbi:MAG TPA: peroxiredoxin [Steroidobacteraceae bacterium]|jgi:peroxiredoxin|nr:peroxiredoxin [Steroidobacteraceae bacterium]
MKYLSISAPLLAIAAFTTPASAALQAGTPAPLFTAQASLNGKSFSYSLKDALKKGTVVVYFYPSAYTQGCDLQAHTFATRIEDFTAAGATVVGVSLDSIDRLNEFSADPDFCAGKFPTASDATGSIAKSFDLAVHDARPDVKDVHGKPLDHGFAERTTFIITPNGKVHETIGGVSPTENVQHSLETIQALAHAQR